MCVRTKTSYDCGHTYKRDESCHSRSCAGLERYHFENEGDCRQCKRGGEAVSRGREGQGRYARELYRKEHKPSTIRIPLSTTPPNTASSPWAPSSKREKDWRSPIRKQADQAWEDEHARREEDLQSRSPSIHAGSVRSAAELDIQHGPRRRDERESAIREELRKIEDLKRIRIRRRRERQASYDSFDSFGESYRSHGSGLNSSGQHSSGLHSHGHHSSGHRSHESGRSRTYDSGFGSAKHNPYNMYNTESYFSGLGQGLGEMVRESSRRWARW